MLDRVGDEVARATTIVRFDPGSHFSPHTHSGGEEFVVIEGVFQDESGDFPQGSYVRNPPTSSHTPSSEPGCTIFVKLHQFAMEVASNRSATCAIANQLNGSVIHAQDREHVDIRNIDLAVGDGEEGACSGVTLHEDACETVRMETWAAGATIIMDLPVRAGGQPLPVHPASHPTPLRLLALLRLFGVLRLAAIHRAPTAHEQL
jgi:hypothetical protein